MGATLGSVQPQIHLGPITVQSFGICFALGFVACLVLAFTLPPASVLTMAAVLAAGVAGRWLVLRFRQHQPRR